MATMSQNASTILSTARQFQAIIELAHQIKEVEEWLGSKSNLEIKVGELTKEVYDKKNEIRLAEEEVVVAKEEAKKIKAEAAKAAKIVKDKADAEASNKIAIADARLREMQASAEKELTILEAKNSEAQKIFDNLQKEIVKAESKLQSTQEALRKLVESVGK